MKQLDPKAVWLFFVSHLVSFTIFGLIAFSWFGMVDVSYMTVNNIFLFIIAIAGISFLVARWTYHYYRYEMADIVFKKEHGIIWKKYVSIPYDRIQNVDIYRGILSRLLGLSDVHIQTAGGITAGSYGGYSEGRLVGVSREEAEILRDQLIQKARQSRSGQGL